jgi:hypothetical protein
VKVHYNSDEPAKLQAHAYAQGPDIHLARGQEKHLPHEAWHVVQQKQGRVRATRQLKGTAVNDNAALEKEADHMGSKALQSPQVMTAQLRTTTGESVVQRVKYQTLAAFFAAEYPTIELKAVGAEVRANMKEAEEQLDNVDFQQVNNISPRVNPNLVGPQGENVVQFDGTNQMGLDPDIIVGYMIHELIHISAKRKYRKNNSQLDSDLSFLNLHLPEKDPRDRTIDKKKGSAFLGMSKGQKDSLFQQRKTIEANWLLLEKTLKAESGDIPQDQYDHILKRISYGGSQPWVENDTALFDLTYYMEAKRLEYTNTYEIAVALLNEARTRRNLPFKGKNKVQSRRNVKQIQAPPQKSWLTKTLGKVRNTLDTIHGI